MKNDKKQQLLSAAVSGLIGAAFAMSSPGLADSKMKAPTAKGTTGKVPCYGANACKGQGNFCGVAGAHDCGGHNACKGQGLMKLDVKDCLAKGGKVYDDALKSQLEKNKGKLKKS